MFYICLILLKMARWCRPRLGNSKYCGGYLEKQLTMVEERMWGFYTTNKESK